ncbi:PEST proteolytic signal-containing nuclear protein [Amyelois transitella]|uniref:PEST proteolytic signal-containing nuclear protein n=1 Tax=Amyelois transitella TaxID=680683 RepID=UPI00067D7D4B|nr:PEST proteolytic signal-containing nuclear protein [Amyelois transitella]
MSNRYQSHSTGSSRSSRDDYRVQKEERDGRDKYRKEKRRTRSRSRSPTRTYSPPRSSKSERSKSRDYEERKISEKNDWEDSDEEVPPPPPPPRITKISIDFSKPKAPIKMNLGGSAKGPTAPPKPTVASVFNDDDDDEPEEMPAEAKMRMRNIGRETPTSAGPNSFGKTKQGFCDAKKVFEKNLKQALETAEKPGISKFPQTIYKIKGP